MVIVRANVVLPLGDRMTLPLAVDRSALLASVALLDAVALLAAPAAALLAVVALLRIVGVGSSTVYIGWKLSSVAWLINLMTCLRSILGMVIMTVDEPFDFRMAILVLVMLSLPMCRWTTLIARRNRVLATAVFLRIV